VYRYGVGYQWLLTYGVVAADFAMKFTICSIPEV
jgi:hypothetical protein